MFISWSHKVFGNVDISMTWLYPMLTFSEKMTKLRLLNKSSYECMTVKRRADQYHELVSYDLVKYAAEITLY